MAEIAMLAVPAGRAVKPTEATAPIGRAAPAQITIVRGGMRANTSNHDISTRMANVPDRIVPAVPMLRLSARAGYE